MGLTRLAISRPVAILMIVGAFLVLGLVGFTQLPAELNPNVDFPTITVSTQYTGTNPQEMETLITKPIEDSIAGVSGIQEIDSTSQEGVSTVRIQFYFGTNLDSADSDVIQKVDAIISQLPVNASTPSVLRADTSGQPVMTIAMQSKSLSQQQIQTLATNIVQPALEQATDVGQVNISQVSTREIHVALDPTRLAAYGITAADVVNALGAANVNVSTGFIQTGSMYYNVRLLGEFSSVDEIRNLRLTMTPGGGGGGGGGASTTVGSAKNQNTGGAVSNSSDLGGSSGGGSGGSAISLYLKDIANITDTVQEPTQASYFEGKPTVTLTVLKTTDGNTLAAVNGVKQELKSVVMDLPPDITFTPIVDQSQQVTANLTDVVTSLFIGAILAVLVVYAFLHNGRGTLIVAIAIPTSMIATFLPMWALGFSLNTMSLMGLSLAVGILVDDSIVVLENINRHLHLGEEPIVAAINGRTEIGLAAIILTSVDLVVFLPIGFMGGVIGEFFRSFGTTVAIATLFSLFVSFTLTPMLAARWYRKGESLESNDRFARFFDNFFERVQGVYQRMLGWGISHPWVVVIVSNLFIVLIFITIGSQLGFRFAPDQDQGQVTIGIEAPAGSSVAYTKTICDQVNKILNTTPDLERDVKFNSTIIGNSGPGLNVTGTQYAHIDLVLWDKRSVLDSFAFWKHQHLRTRSDVVISTEIKQKVKRIAGANILPSNVSGFSSGAPLAIDLSGPDLNKLADASNKVEDILRKTPGVFNVDSSMQSAQPEVDVRLDRTLAAEYGLSLNSVANVLSAAIEGDTSVKYRDPSDGEQYSIRVQYDYPYRDNPQEVANVIVGYVGGNAVRLGDIAQVTLSTGPVKIDHLNRQREVEITGYLLPGYSVGRVSLAVMKQVGALHLYQVMSTFGGDTKSIQREGGYLATAFILGIVLTYMLMAALFNNVVYPFSIMLSLPQAWAGGMIALFIAHEQLSLIAMIGVVLLNAVVNKNAILLVDYTNTLRARGYKRRDALMLAGPTRLKPIMMTTFTIMVSTLPTALALGRGAEFRQSLGVVVEGGITLSLLLTLIVVPSAYVLYDNLTEWVGGNMRRYAERHQLPADEFAGDAYGSGGSPDPVGDIPSEHPAPIGSPVHDGRDGRTGNGYGNGNGDGVSKRPGNGSRESTGGKESVDDQDVTRS